MRRLSLIVALTVVLLGCVGALPAAADDAPPPAFPSGLPKPEDIGNDVPDGGGGVPPGPTFVVTPGSPGTSLPAPVQGPVPESVLKDGQLAGVGQAPSANGGERSAQPGTTVAAPAPTALESLDRPIAGSTWWLAGAAVLMLLVLTEFGRVDQVSRAAGPGRPRWRRRARDLPAEEA